MARPQVIESSPRSRGYLAVVSGIVGGPVDLALVFFGGCVGGAIRYAATSASPIDAQIPWTTLGVNLAGAFIVCSALVLAESLTSARWLRLFVGIGVCGSLTTLASVVDFVDRSFGHGRPVAAVEYLAVTILGGLAAGAFGIVAGRSVQASRRRGTEQRGGR